MKKIAEAACIILQLFLLSVNIYAQWPPRNIYLKKENTQNKIALTFDDGPHPVQTPEILDILKEYDIKSTFFVLGQYAERNPDIIKRIIAEGHEIGNHSYSHKSLKNLPDSEILDEVTKTENVLENIAGIRPKVFRTPGGYWEGHMVELIRSLGYDIVLWSVDPRDWMHTPVDEIAENVIQNTQSGDIILMHDSIPYGTNTPEALRKFIPILLDKGFNFVKVSDLLHPSQ